MAIFRGLKQVARMVNVQIYVASLLAILSASSAGAAPSDDSQRCVTKVSGEQQYVGDRRCYHFGAAVNLKGIWVNEFEGSSFYENLQSVKKIRPTPRHTWLTVDEQTVIPSGLQADRGHAYRVSFVGKIIRDDGRVRVGDGYGHFGMSTGLVVVDRFTQLRDLGWVPKGVAWPAVRRIP